MRLTTTFLLTLLSVSAFGQQAVTVETDTVTRENVAPTMIVSGVVVSREDAAISSELDGRLEWIAEVGDRFEKGEVIARLDTHLIALEERERVAEIAALKANLNWLERQTQRLDELATRNNTARSELDETRARFLMLRQELAQAEVALERTRYDLERAAVRAPFDGVVVSRGGIRYHRPPAVAPGQHRLGGDKHHRPAAPGPLQQPRRSRQADQR